MAEEKITPELVNEIACNAICFQKKPSSKRFNIKELDPKSKQYHENAWEYYNIPGLFVLYESGRIVYENQMYHMNATTRNLVLQTLKDKEKAKRRKEIGDIIRYTLIATGVVVSVVIIAHSVSNAVKSNKKEQSKTEKVQTVKDSVLNPTDTVSILQKSMQR